MSSFPRFTQGALGRLSFEHVNEMMDLLERLRPLLRYAPDALAETKGEFVLARIITSGLGGAHQWEEVVIADRENVSTAPRFETRTGGRRSGSVQQNGEEFQPAFSIMPFNWDGNDPYNFAPNTVVLLWRFSGKDGKIGWLIIGSLFRTSTVFPAVIVNSIAAPGQPSDPTSVRRWNYSWRECDVSNVSSGTVSGLDFVVDTNGRAGGNVPGATLGYAINGCERTGIVGIGGGIPAGATERPAPIANGTVVMLEVAGDGAYFSIPNGMFVSCG